MNSVDKEVVGGCFLSVFQGLTYADLWSYALVHYEMICIGLYLLEHDTDEKQVKKSHRGKRYVATNPPGTLRIHVAVLCLFHSLFEPLID